MSSTQLHTPFSLFFFNATAPTDIYTLSLHDALPIFHPKAATAPPSPKPARSKPVHVRHPKDDSPDGSPATSDRSEEHTSELQSRQYLVCRLLLEKKK